jgi:hypothetical protein
MSSILKNTPAVKFDASNAEHRKAYVGFLNNGVWSVKFELDWPFTSIPSLALFELAAYACKDVGEIDQTSIFKKLQAHPFAGGISGIAPTIH